VWTDGYEFGGCRRVVQFVTQVASPMLGDDGIAAVPPGEVIKVEATHFAH
jgi:hypothetical protein